MWLISLLFLSLASAVFAIPYGIQYYNVTEDYLESHGCYVCYSAAYHRETTSDDILSCTGPILFVGAQTFSNWFWRFESTIYLGAFGRAPNVHERTELNTPNLSNGVYWYFTPGKSFGFLRDTELIQEPTVDIGTENADSRLSWNLDNGIGGDRAGLYSNLKYESVYRKLIYNCVEE